jgi:hypothetical protein
VRPPAPEKFSNSVADAWESSAKHLLLTLESNQGTVVAQGVIAVLRD